jgi:uncharacterized repeat protein (TIGR01451 family)
MVSRMIKPLARSLSATIVAMLSMFVLFLQPWAERPAAQSAPFVSRAVRPHVAQSPLPQPVSPGPAATYPEGEPLPSQAPTRTAPVIDQITQAGGGALLDVAPPDALSAPDVNVPGVTANANPPDTVFDVGPNHIVQMTNNTGYIVFDKQGNPIGGATPNAAIRNLAALYPAGDNCNFFDTDPIVVYDHLADRWLMAWENRAAVNPTGNVALCITVSQTPDPTGAWFAYTFDATVGLTIFPDYEKFGVWIDGYYMSSFEGANLGIFVFDRNAMLTGAAAAFIKRTISSLTPAAGFRETRILPADLDGPPPPIGTPNFFMRPVDDQQDTANPTDRIEIYEAVTDWSTFNLTFNLVSTLAPAAFNTMACNRNGGGARDCIPEPDQPTANTTVDALSNRPMMQLKFRNFGTHFSMVVNQTIDVGGNLGNTIPFTPANEVAGIRWYELRRSGGVWAIQQQGTYAAQPINTTTETQLLHRWMGSAAMDRLGSIALGYSIVNDDNTNPRFPSIAYTGRRFDDVPGLMTQTEQFIFNGANSQNVVGGARWGDYSAMTVDPVDDCTFWYTQHAAAGAGGRPTSIASFRFNYCGTDLAIEKTAIPSQATAGAQLLYTVTVRNNGPDDATGVTVVDTLPAGVTFVTATDSCVQAPVGTLTCSLGNLAAGAAVSFEIRVLVSAGLTGTSGPTTITNTATVSADQADRNPSNNTVSLTTIVDESADLRITKVCKPDTGPAPTGGTASCTTIVDNLGPSDARNVVVTDTHASSGSFTIVAASFVSTSPAASGNCGIAAGVVTCNLGRENAGGRTTITVDITSNSQVDVNDIATVTSATPDPNMANNQATGSVSFRGSADLGLLKTDAPDPVTAGQILTYTMTVSNTGPSSAPNVVVRDVLPKEVTLVSATPSQGACAGTTVPGDPAQPLTCTLDTIASGAGATITVVVRVDSATANGAILVNNASVASDYADPNNANNVSTALTTVQTRADVAVVKSSDADTYKPSSRITYRLDVTNNGPSVARAVVVTDNLPDVHQALYQSDTAGCLRNSATDPTELRCELGDLKVGESRTFFVVLLVRGNKGLVSNTASVASVTTDPNAGNNSSTRNVIVGK